MKSFPNDSFQSGNNNCLNVKRSRVVNGRVSLAIGKWKIVVIYVNIDVGLTWKIILVFMMSVWSLIYSFLPFKKCIFYKCSNRQIVWRKNIQKLLHIFIPSNTMCHVMTSLGSTQTHNNTYRIFFSSVEESLIVSLNPF